MQRGLLQEKISKQGSVPTYLYRVRTSRDVIQVPTKFKLLSLFSRRQCVHMPSLRRQVFPNIAKPKLPRASTPALYIQRSILQRDLHFRQFEGAYRNAGRFASRGKQTT